jgi:uncharacterized membrane protein YdfJ with MMPL/SSD domain
MGARAAMGSCRRAAVNAARRSGLAKDMAIVVVVMMVVVVVVETVVAVMVCVG